MTTGVVKHRLRFSIEDDLWLLREVLGQNPYTDSARWTIIRDSIHLVTGKNFSVRSIKEHVNLLLQVWLRKDNAYKKKSGVEEAAYIEKDILLQKISEISKEQQTVSINKTLAIKEKKTIEERKESRDSWAMTTQNNNENGDINSYIHDLDNNYIVLSTTSTSDGTIPYITSEPSSNVPFTLQKENTLKTEIPLQITANMSETETTQVSVSSPTTLATPSESKILGPIRTRQKIGLFKKSVLDYLVKKNEREFSIRSRELDLHERRVALEEKKLKLDEEKLALEVYERRKRLELEEEKLKMELSERRQMRQIVESQQKIIETLIKATEKKE